LQLFGLPHPTILYDDIFDEKKIKALYNEKTDWEMIEGYVIRNAHQFEYSQFKNNVGKYVRKGHIQTTKHWALGQAIIPNELKSK
jgi:NADPH-dependent curcumin reductase CurA